MIVSEMVPPRETTLRAGEGGSGLRLCCQFLDCIKSFLLFMSPWNCGQGLVHQFPGQAGHVGVIWDRPRQA
jgi:hypothetical protein